MEVKKNILIIAGEKSGEEHLMDFFLELKKKLPDYKFWGVGGDEARQEGIELLYHLKDFGSMGISEVIGKLPFYFSAMKTILSEAKQRKTQTKQGTSSPVDTGQAEGIRLLIQENAGHGKTSQWPTG